jgi:hypothetical protein
MGPRPVTIHANDGPWPAYPCNGDGSFLPAIPTDQGPIWASGSTFEQQAERLIDVAQQHAANAARLCRLLPAMGEELNFSNLNAKLSNPAGAGNAHWQMVTNALTFKYQWETNSFPPFQEFCAKPNRSERGAPIAEEFVNYIRSCAEEITKKDTNFVSKLGGDVKLIQEGDLLVKCGGGAKECYDILASHSNEFKNENWRGCKEIAQRLLKRSERKAVFNRIVGGGWNEITAVELWICSDDGQHTRHPRNDAKSVDYLICVFSAKTK